MLAIWYCRRERSGPSCGSVSSVISGSGWAHSGSKFAMTPSSANRGRSAGNSASFAPSSSPQTRNPKCLRISPRCRSMVRPDQS